MSKILTGKDAAPAAPVVPEIQVSIPTTVIAVVGEPALNQFGTWQDDDLTSLPTFSEDLGDVFKFDNRFGTAGTWSWTLAAPNQSHDGLIVEVTITDDQLNEASATFQIFVQIGPSIAVDVGEEVTVFPEGTTAEVNGVWLDTDATQSPTFQLTPDNGTITFLETPFPFISGTWKWEKLNATPADDGTYFLEITDQDGHRASTEFTTTITPTVPNVLPTIDLDAGSQGPIVLVQGDSLSGATKITGTWTDTDNASNVTITEFLGSVGTVIVQDSDTAGSTWEWSTGMLVEEDTGTYYFIIADDQGGTDFVGLELQINPPTLSLTASQVDFNVAEGTVITSDLFWADSDAIETGPGTPAYTLSTPGWGSVDAPPSAGTSGQNLFTSIALTNATHDGQTLTITINDADSPANEASVILNLSVQAPAVDTPPTIDAPLLLDDPFALADKVAYLEVGAAQVISGIWGDEDADNLEPVTSITSILGVTPFGTVDPVTGSAAFEQTSGNWTISTGSHSVVDHNGIVTVEITDFDSLTASLTIRLDMSSDPNPLRAIPGHPEPSIPTWGIVNGNQQWLVDARAVVHGAGYPIDNEFAVFTSWAEWELFSSQQFNSLAIYRPQFVAHIPATGSITAYVYVTPDGGVESLVEQTTIEGPQSPPDLDTYTVTLQDIDMRLENTHARIVLVGQYDGDDTSSVPQDHKPLLEGANFERVDDVPIPPELGVQVFKFDETSISEAAAAAHFVVGSNFEAIPNGRLRSINNTTNNTINIAPGEWVQFPKNYIAPERNADGSLESYLSLGSPDGHCQIRPLSLRLIDNNPQTTTGIWMKYQQAYRWAALQTFPIGKDYANLPWFLCWQLHNTGKGPNWAGDSNPMCTIYSINGIFSILTRGSTEVVPTNYTHTNSVTTPLIPSSIPQEFIVEWKMDPLGSTSFFRCWINGTQHANWTDPLGVNQTSIGVGASAWMSEGYYGRLPEVLPNPALVPSLKLKYSRLSEIAG